MTFTEDALYGNRAGEAGNQIGGYYDLPFESEEEAMRAAEALAEKGEEYVRQTRGLVRLWDEDDPESRKEVEEIFTNRIGPDPDHDELLFVVGAIAEQEESEEVPPDQEWVLGHLLKDAAEGEQIILEHTDNQGNVDSVEVDDVGMDPELKRRVERMIDELRQRKQEQTS